MQFTTKSKAGLIADATAVFNECCYFRCIRFQEFMADPSIKKTLKTDGLSGACDRLKMNPLSKNLFVCMAEHGRVSNFEGVIASFNSLMSAHRGEVICEVTTAKVSKNQN